MASEIRREEIAERQKLQQGGANEVSISVMPMESSPYLKYCYLEDYNINYGRAYVTAAHRQPQPPPSTTHPPTNASRLASSNSAAARHLRCP